MVYNEKGNYNASIISAVMTKAGSGNQQVEITLQLNYLFGPNNQLINVTAPRFPPRIFLTLTDTTMGDATNPGWVAQVLAYLGFQGDFNFINQIEGWTGTVNCAYQTNNMNPGEQRENWSIVRPAERSNTPPPPPNEIRAINNKYGRLFKPNAAPAQQPLNASPAQQPPDAAPPQQPAAAAQQQAANTDIPF